MLAAVPTVVTIVLVAVAGYLVGSVPIANAVARRHTSDDLRAVGDRNPGYWNAMEQLGTRAALPIFVGDVAKGASGAALGALAAGDGQWWMAYVGGGAAMVGHAWPVFARFRGGRSVLTFVGAVLVVAPMPAVAAVVLLLLVMTATRRFDWAARAGVACYPAIQLIIEGPVRTAATGLLMTLIGVRFLQAGRAAGTDGRATSARA